MKKSPDAVDRHVGSRVRAQRMMLGMSQEKLGYALGLTFQQVQKYEKGTNRIGASRLQQIAQVLQVPVSFFFDGAPGRDDSNGAPAPADLDAFLSSPDSIALSAAFMRIPDRALRRRIVEVVEEIARYRREEP